MANNPKKRGLEVLRKLGKYFTFGGMVLVIWEATFIAANPYPASINELRVHLSLLFFGLAVNQVGLWNVGPRLFSERKYMALRTETDDFIGLVRRLNSAALERKEDGVDRVVTLMHASVERMRSYAGFEGELEGASQQRGDGKTSAAKDDGAAA